MDGQSSVSAAFRGMVMLGGLLAIPAVALFGTGISETVKQFVQRQFTIHSVSSAASFTETPVFVPAGRVGESAALTPPVVTMPAIAPAEQPAAPAAGDGPVMAPVSLAPQPRSEVMAVSGIPSAGETVFAAVGHEPATVVRGPGPAQAEEGRSSGPIITSIYENPANLVPVVRAPDSAAPAAGASLSEEPRRLLALREAAGLEQPAGEASASERFVVWEARLRQWGATYSRLESWGPGGERYRFSCKMGIGGSTHFTRCFEAIDTDPMTAMAKVVADVEQWRSRLAGGR